MKYLFVFLIFLFFQPAISQTTKWKIIWDKNPEKDIKEYVVYKNKKEIARVNANETSYVDQELEPGLLYTYQIKAVNQDNKYSDFSDEANAAIPALKNFPSVISISKNKSINIRLKDYIIDPDNDKHTIQRINNKSSSKLMIELNSGNLILKASDDWMENTIDTVKIKISDSNGFFNIATLVVKDVSTVNNPIQPPWIEQQITIFPKEFSLDQYSELTISNLPAQSSVFIYDSFGSLVFSEKNISDTFEWNAENNDGDQVLFGLYSIIIQNVSNQKIFEGTVRIIP